MVAYIVNVLLGKMVSQLKILIGADRERVATGLGTHMITIGKVVIVVSQFRTLKIKGEKNDLH